jgi:hypothetical protein
MTSQVEIVCTACGADTLLRREPFYEGFRKVGDRLLCASCGHEFEDEESVPYKRLQKAPSVFSEADRSKHVDVFAADEKGCLCRYCMHYVVNPFTQRCGLHNQVVEATDTCPDFEKKEESEEDKLQQGDNLSL